jgi:NodT family efflux transporter outer membrane factor (OMF) lipoprotein
MSRAVSACLVPVFLTACTVGPDYQKPAAPVPTAYKERKGWKLATPRDAFPKGNWWRAFRDPQLDGLEQRVAVSNQTLKQSEAAYRQSLALIKEAQAGLFPTLDASYTGARSRTTGGYNTNFTLEAAGNWDIDVWGRIRRSIESSAAAAQASDADLANATLSAQAQLAVAYFNLRAADSLHALLARTAADYQRTLDITQNQYKAGTSARSDVITALSQLKNAQAQLVNTGVLRAQYEHAIAVLTGRPPADLSIKAGGLAIRPPSVPASVPSALLERRPDIATAERTMQQQNALIGEATAALYPDISLSGLLGFSGRRALPLTVANEIWSVAASATQTLADGGLHKAQIEAAQAGYDASVASYRQTVLTAFQQVEDQLSTLRILSQQSKIQGEAVAAARQAVQINLNEYRAGTIPFTTVVTAQATLLGDEETALNIRQQLFVATVSLIAALGGGWDTVLLPQIEELSATDPAAIIER